MGRRFGCDCVGGKTEAGDRRLGLQRVGRQVSAVGFRTTTCRRGIAEEMKLPVFYPGHRHGRAARSTSNGAGTVMTTTSCLLNKESQSKAYRRSESRNILRDYYGPEARDLARRKASRATIPTATSTIWRASSTTERSPSHRDQQARSELRDPAEGPAAPSIRRSIRRQSVRDRRAADADARSSYEGQRVPATYVNFYFANGALLVPTFGQRDRDRKAIAFCRSTFRSAK
jgi:agmatine deiminase